MSEEKKRDRRPLTLREIQLAELKILHELVRCFDAHDLHYILCGGTMLGAVRHRGFIPWDDDVDILVPRDDYERLKKLYSEGQAGLRGVELILPGDPGSPHTYIKACDRTLIVYDGKREDSYRGYVYVDVFPMDHFPDDERTHRRYVRRISTLIRILSSNTIGKDYLRSRGYYRNPLKMLELAASRVLYRLLGGNSRIAARVDRIARDMDARFKDSNHVGDGAWPNGMKDYFPMSSVEPVMKHRFEDADFNIPVNYDAYLTHFYGDYMQIPPESERMDHHMTVYRIDAERESAPSGAAR